MSEERRSILCERLLTAEQGVLGSMLIDGDVVGRVLMIVSEEDFQLPENRILFQAIKLLYGQGRACDPILINETLGGDYGRRMAELMELTPTAANAEEYARALREVSRLWRIREIGEQLEKAEDLNECRELVDQAYVRCENILTRCRRELEITARFLLDHETMDAATFAKVFDDPDADEFAQYRKSLS